MKKLLLSMMMMLPLLASADTVEIEGIYYNLNSEEKTAEVTENPSKYSGEIIIPEIIAYEGSEYIVLSIGEGAFGFCKGLISVTIPNSVTTIGDHLFDNCLNLISVNFGNSLTSISASTFASCHNLTSVNIPNSVTAIENAAFANCWSLTSVTIPNSVITIGNGAFNDCRSLNSITIPESVTSIGYYTFEYCSNLTSIVVEKSNTIYDSRNNCNAIIETSTNTLICGCKTTIIPDNITSIGTSAFSGCKGLSSVSIPNSVTSIGISAFSGCEGLSSVSIPNSVTSIEDFAFYGCEGLSSVSIPNSVISIGKGAFGRCEGLSSVSIPNSVTSIGDEAFQYCKGLSSVSIPNSVTTINSGVFQYCSSLISVVIPNSVTTICPLSFWGCHSLTSVIIPNSVTSIGHDAFYYCEELKTIESQIESPFNIENNTFDDSIYRTAELTVPSGTKAAYQARGGWSLFKNIVEKDVRKFESGGISYNVNDNGTSVTVTAGSTKYQGNITIPSSVSYNGKNYDVTSIGYGAFGDCTGLTSISIPNSVMYIQYGAFQNCSGLTSITLPNSIQSIGQYAFMGCYGLTKIVSEIESPFSLEGSTFENSTFDNATLTVPAGTKAAYQARGGWKNFKNIVEAGSEQGGEVGQKILVDGIYYVIGTKGNDNSVYVTESRTKYEGDIEIPSQVTYNNKTYPVTSIGYEAFEFCINLTSIIIPNSVIDIGSEAFKDCSGLKSISIPNSVTVIWNEAFSYCSGLTTITIPNSVTYISMGAFGWCNNLKDVYCYAENVPETEIIAFIESSINEATLHVPAGSIDAYKAVEPWNQFKEIVAIEDTGISSVSSCNTIQEVYSINGERKLSPNKGINIIRMSDGKKIKIFIK